MKDDGIDLKTLSPAEKRELLREVMARRSERIEAEHPATAGQRALWFLQMRAPSSVAYNVIVAARIGEPVQRSALTATLQELIARHAALRTTYHLRAGTLLQVIARELPPPLVEVDVSGHDDTALRERIEADAHQPFQLTTGPVLLARLYTRAPGDHVFLLVVHHIAIDGMSMEVLMAELRELYLHHATGGPSPPWRSTPGGSYAAYAAWEHALLTSPEGERLWRYWKETLAGEIPALTLPLTRMPDEPLPTLVADARPAFQGFEGAECVFKLDDDVAALARTFARSRRVTLYTVMLGGLLALLHRYTGQRDLCVGSFVAQRPRQELERAVGYYINTVALRVHVDAETDFSALVERVSQRVLEALDHKDFPFAALVERLSPYRDPSRSPLFDIALNQVSAVQFEAFTGVDLGAVTSAGRSGEPFELAPYPLRRRFARFDLEITLGEGPSDLALYFQYSTGVLDRETIACMMAHLQQLLREALRRPDAPLSGHGLLTPAERRRLVPAGDALSSPPAPATCLHHRFEAQARRTPEAIAVRAAGASLSYCELDARADAIAAELRRRGVGPEVPVAVCVERSLALLPALLGVLKAGGAYVPLDPAYPRDRLRAMITDSGAALVLTTGSTAPLCDDVSATPVRVDGSLPAPDVELARAAVDPDHLAYIIYTSGSTGQPKGVEVSHRGCAALFQWADATLPATDFRATLASTSICFDVSVFELFYPLGVGGTLVLVDTPLHLVDLGPDSEVTCVVTVPAVMGALVDLPSFPRSVRTVYLAGEPLRRGLVERIHAWTAIERVYNLYGPTENTVYSTWCEVPRGEPGEPTIGRAIPGCQAYVLDETLQPVPVLHVGELCLGGVAVARGYHRRPELTQERFVPDPFTSEPGGRMYRTGDLARLRPDGQIELLGRRDLQVKLHGYRIELGEIEAVLSQHPGVLEAAVRVQEYRGDRRLVGYLAPASMFHGDPDDLREGARRHLEQTLPAYMVPPVLVVLPELPHTPNGKLDRARLPDPSQRHASSEGAPPPPRGPTAGHLAAVWAELLQMPAEGIGDHDTFFSLGGHSLLLARMAQMLSVRFARRVTVADLFQRRDIAAIAAWLDAPIADDPSAVQGAEDRAQQRRKQFANLRRPRAT